MLTHLERINYELAAWAGPVRRGATQRDITSLKARAKSVLALDLPQAYVQLLTESDGVQFMFLSIYGARAFVTHSYPRERVPGFVEGNLKWRKHEGLEQMVVFGETMGELHVYNGAKNCYQTIDSVNGLPFDTYATAEQLFANIMRDGLYG